MKLSTGLMVPVACLFISFAATAGTFSPAEQFEDPNVISHPAGYIGSGGTITRTVCIDPGSPSADELAYPTRKAVETINSLVPKTSNQKAHPDVGPDQNDAWSVITHELLHCSYGLGHTNLTVSTGIFEADYTNSLKGPDDKYTGFSGDNTIGNEEDFRGDDINIHWFRKADNNPLIYSQPADASSLSIDLADLPADHFFAVNTNLGTSADRGFPATKSIMYSRGAIGLTLRDLSPDDVTTINLSQSGLDRTAGTMDDLQLELEFVGIDSSCDIPITIGSVDPGRTGVCSVGATVIIPTIDHYQILNTSITLSSAVSWFFEPSVEIFEDGFESGDLSMWSPDP